MTTKAGSRTPIWIVLACALAGLILALYPMYVIRPFRAQGVNELQAALLIMRVRPLLTLLFAGLAAFAAFRYWREQHNRTRKIAIAAAVVITCVTAVIARVNVFEIMFNPVPEPTFETVANTRLDAGEMVLAVHVNGAARAYPVRAIAYHHIVNDTVGGVPIVGTY